MRSYAFVALRATRTYLGARTAQACFSTFSKNIPSPSPCAVAYSYTGQFKMSNVQLIEKQSFIKRSMSSGSSLITEEFISSNFGDRKFEGQNVKAAMEALAAADAVCFDVDSTVIQEEGIVSNDLDIFSVLILTGIKTMPMKINCFDLILFLINVSVYSLLGCFG